MYIEKYKIYLNAYSPHRGQIPLTDISYHLPLKFPLISEFFRSNNHLYFGFMYLNSLGASAKF